MSCPTNDDLISYAAGDLTDEEAARVADHLASGCDSCTVEIATVSELRHVTNSDALTEPPPWILSRAAAIPSQPPVARLAELAGSLASLVFDTLRDPLPHGARSSASSSRQMLFRALDYDIDIRVASVAGGKVKISGQILPGNDRPIGDVAGIDVLLVADGGSATPNVTNELGEFEFAQLLAGDYSLLIETPDDRLRVENLSLHAA